MTDAEFEELVERAAEKYESFEGDVHYEAMRAALAVVAADLHEKPVVDPGRYAERVARHFHRTYDRLSASFGWTPQESARGKDFDELPGSNRRLMVATVRGLLEAGVIVPGLAVLGRIEVTDLAGRTAEQAAAEGLPHINLPRPQC